MEVFWTAFAEDDLDAIFDYYAARGDQDVAVSIIRDIRHHTDSLAKYPCMGGLGRISGTRELLVGRRYYIVYRVKEDNIHILNIINTSQKYPPDPL